MKKLFTLLAGICISALVFGQTQRMVLYEEFIGENCPPCAAIAPDVDAIITGGHSSEVIYMQYLTDIPSPGTLYYENISDPTSRRGFYNFNSTPSGVQDGVQWDSSLSPPANTWYNPDQWAINPSYLDNEYAVGSPFTLDVSHTFNATGDSFYATINLAAVENFTARGALKLQVVMVEDLQFEYSPGNNGVTWFPHAVRKMYPNSGGTALSATWTNGQNKTVTIGGKTPTYIRDKTQVTFIAFIQDLGNKHVEQAAISSPYTFDVDLQATSVQGNFGNCNNAQYTPLLNIANVGNQSIFSYNILEYADGLLVDSSAWTGNLPASNSLPSQLSPIALTPGVHTLTFTLSNPNFAPDANPGNNTVSITLNMPNPSVQVPLVEGFESGADNWVVEAPDHDSTWRIVNTGNASSHSFMMDYYDNLFGDFVGPIDNLYSPVFDLTYAAHATVVFERANQMINFGNGYGIDSLHIDVSKDCGNTWQTVYSNGFQTLATSSISQNYGPNLGPYTPLANDWKQDSADISVVANNPNVLLRFRAEGYDGNNLYLDNINIYKYDSVPYTAPSAINQVSNVQSVNVYPNPANTQIRVDMELSQSAEVSCVVTDVTGKMVAEFPAEVKGIGENTFTIPATSLSDGFYIVTVSAGSNRISKKVAVIH